MKTETHKVYLVNCQTIGASCGYGIGKTKEEAIADAIELAKHKGDPNPRYEGGQVWFRGGVNC